MVPSRSSSATANAVGRSAGHPKAWLAVATGNVRARRFYDRCGWADEGAVEYAAATESGTTPVPSHRYTVSTAD